ncbi:methyltransferase domain-containing protein [Candidatus Woesearchaeota archaeon]|nr:methyltransferase domain-containing protein [Candidatus Woesearchaeota archaeon]
MEERFLEKLKKIKRGPAIILQKDAGVILANTSIDKNSVVLDAGSGCGVLTANLARFVKKVYSYDNRKEFLEIAKENAKMLGLKNIVFRNKDIFENIKDKNLDLITLDLKDSWRALENCKKALKENGELAVYFPNITQVHEFVNKLGEDFKLLKVIEDIQREWIVDERRARPENIGILHTGFLVFVKKN